MWKEPCFWNKYACCCFLLFFNLFCFLFCFWGGWGSMVQVCDSYIHLYFWWCPHNMWDRLLIKYDWLLTLESKKQISLWHVYLYICGRVVFSVCACFVTVCGDCILGWLKVNMVRNLNIYRLDIESWLVTVFNILFYWIFSLKSGCSFWSLVQ